MPFLCRTKKNCKKHNDKKTQFDPKYSLKRVISTLYETSFAEGREEGRGFQTVEASRSFGYQQRIKQVTGECK